MYHCFVGTRQAADSFEAGVHNLTLQLISGIRQPIKGRYSAWSITPKARVLGVPIDGSERLAALQQSNNGNALKAPLRPAIPGTALDERAVAQLSVPALGTGNGPEGFVPPRIKDDECRPYK
jgi:hypothetical protein